MADSSQSRRVSHDEPQEQKQSTSELFKDMISQKRNMIMSRLTSFDSDVSIPFHSNHISYAYTFCVEKNINVLAETKIHV